MLAQSEITTVICAHNAAKTIERAVQSAMNAGTNPILLVNDHSTDGTVELAKTLTGKRLKVATTAEKRGIGNARQTALQALDTPYALWLDADDELIAGRPERMLDVFASQQADFVYDSATLKYPDGQSAELSMPEFLKKPDGILRLFERNWLPGLWGGFRTAAALETGYDCAFLNSEDYDFLLRGMMHKKHIHLLSEQGYRYYHSDTSISRNIQQAMHFTSAANAKHSPDAYQKRLRESQLPVSEQSWILGCIQLMTQDYQGVLDTAQQHIASDPVIEPYGVHVSELMTYLTGTALTFLGRYEEALNALQKLPLLLPEQLNNYGVCLKAINRREEAATIFQKILALKPHYLDAQANLASLDTPNKHAITLLPLRPTTSRSLYRKK